MAALLAVWGSTIHRLNSPQARSFRQFVPRGAFSLAELAEIVRVSFPYRRIVYEVIAYLEHQRLVWKKQRCYGLS